MPNTAPDSPTDARSEIRPCLKGTVVTRAMLRHARLLRTRRAFSSSSKSIYEWRTDALLSQLPLSAADLSLAPEPCRLAAWKTEVGGQTNEVHRLYAWDSFDSRDKSETALPRHASQPLVSSSRCGARSTHVPCASSRAHAYDARACASTA
jgi:hypothetical protein